MKIEPLEGKYYGTIVAEDSGPLKGIAMELWCCTGNPSNRQLAQWGFTRKQWDDNIEIDDGWGGKIKIRESDFMCDSHYESQETYELAKRICDMENTMNKNKRKANKRSVMREENEKLMKNKKFCEAMDKFVNAIEKNKKNETTRSN